MQTNPPNPQPLWINVIFNIEGNLKIIFFPSAILAQGFATIIAFAICLLGILLTCKRPLWNVEYGQKVIMSEFTHNLIYMMVFVMFPQFKHITFYIPLGIHFAIGVAEYSYLTKGFVYSKFSTYVDRIRANRVPLLEYKAKFELYQLFFFIVFVFIHGFSVLILAFIYGNFIRMKYVVSPHTRKALMEVNYWIDTKVLSHPSCPAIARTLITKLRSILTSMPTGATN